MIISINRVQNLFLGAIALFLSIVPMSCASSHSGTNEVFNYDERINPDIPIDISLKHIQNPDDQDYDLTYEIAEQDNDCIRIEPTSTYYDNYVSGVPFYIPTCSYWDSETNEYPLLSCSIINNSNEDLSIDRLEVIVHSSKIDQLPYIHIFFEEDHSNTMTLINESYVNWGGMTLDYTILKKGETFDGNYRKSRTIDFFEDSMRIDLLDDLIEMGYDYERACKMCEEPISAEQPFLWLDINNDNFDEYSSVFAPFEFQNHIDASEHDAFARINGRITFQNSSHPVYFEGRISLSTHGDFGGACSDADAFDVELRTDGENYTLMHPYITKIPAHGVEKISLAIKCDKSTVHKFRINAINSNELVIASKEIYLHYLNPPHSSKHVYVEEK